MAESSAKKKRVKASLEEGTVWVWGDNARGQLLELPPCDEAVTPRLAERGLNGPLRGGWNALRRGEEGSEEAAQGAEHWLEVDGQGRLRGAGRSLEGQLGAVVRELVTVPRAIALEVRVTSVACGGQHSAAAGEGLLFTWGANAFGQLGHSAGHVVVPGPVAVGALWPVTVTAVALGARHSAALSATGRLFLFGCNTAGQCGPGRDDFVLAAVEQVSLGVAVQQVVCGAEHTVALLRGGEVRQWGATVSPPPSNLPRAAWVAAGRRHSAAALSDGSVACWGDPARGAGLAPPRNVRGTRVLCGNDWTCAYTPRAAAWPPATPTTPTMGGSQYGSLEQLEAAGPGALRPGAAGLRALAPLVRRALEYSAPGAQERERQALGWALLRVGAGAAGAAEVAQAAELLRGFQEERQKREKHQLTLARLPEEFRAAMEAAKAANNEEENKEDGNKASNNNNNALNSSFNTSVSSLIPADDFLLEDGTARHWTGLAQAALAEQLQRTRSMSRAETLPLLWLLALLRAATPPPASPLRFYSDLVSRRLDVSLDYERWARGLPSICGDYSWLLHPATKAAVLQEEARISMDQMYADAVVREMLGRAPTSPFLEMVVRREHLISDTLERLAELETRGSARAFRKRLKVTFEGEQGLDEGGVTKEYFLLLVRQLFRPEYALVTWDETKTLCWFSPAALENESEFKLVGIVFGLAIYNSTILDVHFPPVIYSYLLDPDYEPTFEDLKGAFPALAAGLQALLDYPEDDVEDVFCLSFAVSVEHFGSVATHELLPGGAAVPVTRANRHDYVARYTRWALLDSVAPSLRAFVGGFSLLAKRDGFLQHLLPQELERIVCGYPHWNLAELQRVTSYEGGFAADSPVIVWFWEVVASMSTADQHRLLSFATGSDRVPVGGFAEMEFVIQRQGEDSEALPTSHTCFNVLLLPEYSSLERLRHKLEFAIQQTEGFMLI